MKTFYLKLEKSIECLLDELASEAYQVALKHKPQGSFIDLELEIWWALRDTVEKNCKIASRRAEKQKFDQ